jgi:hypothetical protein
VLVEQDKHSDSQLKTVNSETTVALGHCQNLQSLQIEIEQQSPEANCDEMMNVTLIICDESNHINNESNTG